MALDNCSPLDEFQTVYRCVLGRLWRDRQQRFKCDESGVSKIVWITISEEDTGEPCDESDFPEIT